ncbi:MAG: thioredoxin [Bacteroidetes bacterium]|nr:MAG: thioredoxin [Bacteroidota bacterium]
MNRLACFISAIFLAGCAATALKTPIKPALQLFETLPDAEEKKILRGFLSKTQLTEDTSFAWYAANGKFLKANEALAASIAAKASQVELVLFVGTWCHDSQQLLPKYFKTLEAANFPPEKLTIIGVDRSKTTIGNLHKIFGITNIPTLIVMQDGKELGRIVEYGTSGQVDKALASLISSAK